MALVRIGCFRLPKVYSVGVLRRDPLNSEHLDLLITNTVPTTDARRSHNTWHWLYRD